MTRWTNSARALVGLTLLLGTACGDRPAAYDVAFDAGRALQRDPTDPSGDLQVRGLTGSVALLDPALNQMMLFTSPRPLALATKRLPVGRDVVEFKSSVNRDKLFVLSRGVTPRYKDSDEAPQLRVFDGGTDPQELEKFELQDPYNELEIDQQGEWLIVHGSEGLVSNPNELILVHLGQGAGASKSALTTKTLDSYGGKPVRFTFTSELSIPGAQARRLLVVQREKDLAIIDLQDLRVPEITVGLKQLDSGEFASPLDVVYHDGVDGEVNSLLAVQLKSDSDVYLLSINAAHDGEHEFSLDPNLVDVGGVPSQLDFVQTRKDGGLRLAALVPGNQVAKLVDPSSGSVQDVPLPVGFTQIRRITDALHEAEASGQDIALLYGASTNTIAFWQLGTTTGTPYRSIDAYNIGIKVSQVFDIPGETFPDRKILSGTSTGSTQQFYVLDLSQRKSFPLDVLTNLTLNLSPNGEQLWAFGHDQGFAQLTFEPLQPSSLYTERPISFVHDFATARGEDERTAMALHVLSSHGHATVAATLFDGLEPSTARTTFYSELELEGIK